MSQWYYQQDRHLRGPVSFTRLARLVVDDELDETDVARRAGETQWLPLSSIVGLRQTCEILAGRRRYVAPVAAEIDTVDTAPVSVAEARDRAFDRAYRQSMNAPNDTGEGEPISRRDALLVWGPLGLFGTMIAGAVAYQLASDPWESRTYKRTGRSDDE